MAKIISGDSVRAARKRSGASIGNASLSMSPSPEGVTDVPVRTTLERLIEGQNSMLREINSLKTRVEFLEEGR